jgi:hypothetical protein
MSTNGGASFSTVTSFPDVFASAIGIAPDFAHDGTLFAAGCHGLFKSTDGGSTWTYLVSPARIGESRGVVSPLEEPIFGFDLDERGRHCGWQRLIERPKCVDRDQRRTLHISFARSASGSGNAVIQFTYEANSSANARIGSITIA